MSFLNWIDRFLPTSAKLAGFGLLARGIWGAFAAPFGLPPNLGSSAVPSGPTGRAFQALGLRYPACGRLCSAGVASSFSRVFDTRSLLALPPTES